MKDIIISVPDCWGDADLNDDRCYGDCPCFYYCYRHTENSREQNNKGKKKK